MVKKMLDKMTPRQRLVTVGAAAAVALAAMGGCTAYAINKGYVSDMVKEPKQTLASTIDQAVFRLDPGAYIGVAVEELDKDWPMIQEYRDDLNTLGGAMFESNPGEYTDLATQLLREKPGAFVGYEQNFSDFAKEVDNQGLMTDEASMYFFEENAGRVNSGIGMGVCQTKVMSRATEEQKLQYVLEAVDDLDVQDYGIIMQEMGSKGWGWFTERLNEIWPW